MAKPDPGERDFYTRWFFVVKSALGENVRELVREPQKGLQIKEHVLITTLIRNASGSLRIRD